MKLAERLQSGWLKPNYLTYLALPLSFLYGWVMSLRLWLYRKQILASQGVAAKVLVVGNLSVGGTGKSPIVADLALRLTALGQQVGILSRGYGGDGQMGLVGVNDDASSRGDEAVMLAQRSGCPVMVSANRLKAAEELVALGCNVIISDDGFQHLALRRDLDILVVDGRHGFANAWPLPAGPLREWVGQARRAHLALLHYPQQHAEAPSKVAAADATMNDLTWQRHLPERHYRVTSGIDECYALHDSTQRLPLTHWRGKRVHGVAAIGDPARFFGQLEAIGIALERHGFADHHAFVKTDFALMDVVLMTEKDAVKCQALALDCEVWVVPLRLTLPDAVIDHICEELNLVAR